MNVLKCITVTTKMLLWKHTPQHEQKLSLKSTIIEQCVVSIWTCEFMDKTLQIAEKQLVMTIDKAQETKLQRYRS